MVTKEQLTSINKAKCIVLKYTNQEVIKPNIDVNNEV